MAKVHITEEGSTAGVWVTADDMQIGIVGQDGHGAYIAFYNTKTMKTPVAIMAKDLDKDGNDDLMVQVPTGEKFAAKQFNLNKVLDALSKLN